ncbi:chondroitinase-B domain-containing protein [Sphingobacterium sp. FBM7-1]|uniref:chondroitinase-B domain-containing protein n=1 Tax=Sphingobacterium sp. FBM7-1 TaxID=2886688 RepID=UPI001D0F75B4|nr:chondroitinase-B domain-containing protein [Sphingobacterium sp. FBM7-1]MCC2600167.1 coagulation factor 5/8 type domain-containing protein [Sphingobacterium sp. FBM7-1]
MKQLIFFIFLTGVSCGATSLVQLPTDESQPQNSHAYTLIKVESTTQLKKALAEAQPGDSIVVAPGTYEGRFILAKSGTETHPIIVEGAGPATILDAGDTNTGYVFHLQGNYCKIKKMTLQNGLKGFMADNASFNTLTHLTVKNTGEEAIHLRKFSSHNVVQHCDISTTGLKRPGYGEGIYIGTANSNWARYTNGEPDKCDYNAVINNKIGSGITAECIDIKEGTSYGLIAYNTFYADGISGENSADSWLDVKGNSYQIENNQGYHDGSNTNFLDGVQVNCAYEGWGSYNIFSNNSFQVNAAGYAINVRLKSSKGEAVGNIIDDTNEQEGAQKGLTNITITNK